LDVRALQRTALAFGLDAAVYDLLCRASHKLTGLLILKGITLSESTLDREFLEKEQPGYRWGFLERDDLLKSMHQGAGEDMDAAFIDEAFSRGDRCYGVFVGDTLASYGWYSARETKINDDLLVRFDPAYMYRYKGYTLPVYRGQRLHGVGIARSLSIVLAEGRKGLVSYVRANNFASLRSCYRVGYKDFGEIVIARVGGRYWIHAAEGCKDHGFRVELTREAPRLLVSSVLA